MGGELHPHSRETGTTGTRAARIHHTGGMGTSLAMAGQGNTPVGPILHWDVLGLPQGRGRDRATLCPALEALAGCSFFPSVHALAAPICRDHRG